MALSGRPVLTRSARALWGLSWVEFWAGHWALAAEHAGLAHDISIQYGLEVPLPLLVRADELIE